MGDRLGILSAVGFFFKDNMFSVKDGLNFRMIKKCLRPYHVEHTSSRQITEVKQRRAKLVLGWVTAWEYLVP